MVNRAIIPQEYSCMPSNYSDGILKNTDRPIASNLHS